MAHPYTQEQTARTEYVELSQARLVEVLVREEVQASIGAGALALLHQTEGMYIPEVTEEGVVTLSAESIRSDAIPVLALRDDERVVRDVSFATFTPRQYASAPDNRRASLGTAAARVAAGAREPFIAQTFGQAAAVMRMTYAVPDYPATNKTTYFNMRPLMLLRYDPEAEHARASTLANALMQAEQVMTHPVTVVQGEEGFDELNAQWRTRGYELAAMIDRALDNS